MRTPLPLAAGAAHLLAAGLFCTFLSVSSLAKLLPKPEPQAAMESQVHPAPRPRRPPAGLPGGPELRQLRLPAMRQIPPIQRPQPAAPEAKAATAGTPIP